MILLVADLMEASRFDPTVTDPVNPITSGPSSEQSR
jgi:hypothetical protein